MERALSIEVSTLRQDQIGRATDVLARAFDEDPILTFFLNEPRRRRLAYELLFRAMLAEHIRYGHVYAAHTEGRLVATAVWRPPSADGATAVDRRRWRLAELGIRALFPGRARAMFAGFAATEHFHPNEPHWYLFFVGVRPGVQGAGVGTKLLAPPLALADRERRLCYLETPFPRTHQFYRRLGFEVTAETRPFEGAPPLWLLLRQPRPS